MATDITYTIVVTNEDLRTDTEIFTKSVEDYAGDPPVINSLVWDHENHSASGTYQLTINATDPNSQDLTYDVVCDEGSTTITQTGTLNIWSVTYPNFGSDTTVVFTITVTNEDLLTDVDTDTKVVAAEQPG